MNLVKILTLVSLFKDVSAEYEAAGKAQRPWYAQRTFWGSILAVIGAAGAAFLGVTLDQASMDIMADNIPQLISVVITVWGSLLSLYGMIMKTIKK